MMIASNSQARRRVEKKEEVKGEYGGIWGEEQNVDYEGMVQLSQQHVAPQVKEG